AARVGLGGVLGLLPEQGAADKEHLVVDPLAGFVLALAVERQVQRADRGAGRAESHFGVGGESADAVQGGQCHRLVSCRLAPAAECFDAAAAVELVEPLPSSAGAGDLVGAQLDGDAAIGARVDVHGVVAGVLARRVERDGLPGDDREQDGCAAGVAGFGAHGFTARALVITGSIAWAPHSAQSGSPRPSQAWALVSFRSSSPHTSSASSRTAATAARSFLASVLASFRSRSAWLAMPCQQSRSTFSRSTSAMSQSM